MSSIELKRSKRTYTILALLSYVGLYYLSYLYLRSPYMTKRGQIEPTWITISWAAFLAPIYFIIFGFGLLMVAGLPYYSLSETAPFDLAAEMDNGGNNAIVYFGWSAAIFALIIAPSIHIHSALNVWKGYVQYVEQNPTEVK